MTDTVVIGAGLAGLSAAIRLAQQGQTVTLLTFGIGGIQLGQGSVDVLGYAPDSDQPVTHPFDELPGFAAKHPGHPYALFDAAAVKAAVDWLAGVVPAVLVAGDGENHLVPTALGAMRPTYLVQPSMVWPGKASLAVVGPRQIKDFYPELCAANLAKTAGVTATGYHIDLPARPGEVDSFPVNYAKALDDPAYLDHFADLVKAQVKAEEAICLPAILGLAQPDVAARLAAKLGRPVVEALLPPPSVPGMRLNEALTQVALSLGVRVVLGSKVTGFQASTQRLESVTLHEAGHDQAWAADNFVYTPGGFESGALRLDSYGTVSETVFGLPLTGTDQPDLITGDYWNDQALFAVGVGVDQAMRPLDGAKPVYENLHVAGGLLAGAIRWAEKSGDAIAVASAVQAADAITGGPVTKSAPATNQGKKGKTNA